MFNLLITLMAIALQAAALFATMNYSPNAMKAAPDQVRLMAASLSSFENAFYRYGAANNGLVPEPTAATDGGLSQFQTPARYLAFMPKAPAGFQWKYGSSVAHYVCLQSVDVTRPMDASIIAAIKRLQRLLPDGQLVLSEGARTCGETTDVSNSTAGRTIPLSLTFFLRYSANGLPSTLVLPCRGNACLSSDTI